MGRGNGNGSGRLNGYRNLNWGQDHLVGYGSWYGFRKMERVQKLKGYGYLEKEQEVGMGTGHGMGTGIRNGYR